MVFVSQQATTCCVCFGKERVTIKHLRYTIVSFPDFSLMYTLHSMEHKLDRNLGMRLVHIFTCNHTHSKHNMEIY